MMNNNTELEFSSDLMQNFKALRPASTEKHMQAVCCDGVKAFLAISDDGKLFVTAEKEQSSAGWERTDISGGIRGECGLDARVVSFSVNTDRSDSGLVLAAAVLAGENQSIYISANNSLTKPAWIKVNLPKEIQALTFYDISISSWQGKLFITAYYKEKNGSINRYSIVSADGTYSKWIYTPLPTDFTDITDTRLGRPSYSRVDGTYTLGMSHSSSQLLFTPAYNYYDPELAPASSRLTLPCRADAISVLPSPAAAGRTDVFVCGDGSLYWFSDQNQDDLAVPVQIAKSFQFRGVKQLFSFVSKGRVYVWVLNESKNLCYLFADQEKIKDPEAWSVVAVLKEDLDYVYPFREGEANAMYAYTKKGEGILGYESEETGLWTYVTVFVSENTEKAVPINSYVTRIKTPQPEQEVWITAQDSCMVEINGGIYSLRGNPVRVKSTASGDIRITELAESVNAAKFTVCLDEEDGGQLYDPGKDVTDRLFALNTAESLSRAVITRQTGQTEYLIPRDISKQSLDAVASAMKKLDAARKNLNLSCENINGGSGLPSGICLRFQDGEIRQSSLSDEEHRFYASVYGGEGCASPSALCSGPVVYSSEDVLGFMRSLCSEPAEKGIENGFFDVIIDFFDNAWNFIVKTAEKIVSFVLDCVEKVAACAVELLHMIEVTIEKIIDFLKYVFDMEDILNMKDILKKILNVAQKDMKDEVVKCKGIVKEAFQEIDQYILDWGGIEDIGDVGHMSLRQMQDNSPEGQQINDVHASYLTDLVVDNREAVNLTLLCQPEKMNLLSGKIDDLISILSSLYEGEKEVVENLVKRLQNEFFSDKEIADMDILTVLRKLAAIAASALVEGVGEIVEVLFDLVVYVLDVFYDMLNEDIYIPCVSEFLELCGIGPFSIMDLVCFLPAFMGTIIYKIAAGKAIFSSGIHGRIMSIHSLSDLRTIMANVEGVSDASGASFNKELFQGLKIGAAVATFLECILAAVDFSTERKFGLLGLAVAGMSAIDGGLYMANSFFVYEPLAGKLPKTPKYVLTVVKYLPFLGKVVSLYYSVLKKNKAMADKWDTIFGTLYAVTSFISIGGNIYYIVAASELKDVDSREKTIYILDTVSLIPDNLRNVADGILRYVKPAEIPAFVIILVIRSLCGIGYGVLQIVEGSYACGGDTVSVSGLLQPEGV